MAKRPLVFGIGLPESGGPMLSALFANNGYGWRDHMGGKLAVDLAYAQATGETALEKWDGAAGFSGLYRTDKRHLPPLHVIEFLPYLKQMYQDAYFILTTRDPEDWITARFLAEDGLAREAAAWHAGCRPQDLPEHWVKESQAHIRQCTALLRGKRRFLNFNISSDPIDKMCDFLHRDFDFPVRDGVPSFEVTAQDKAKFQDQISTPPPAPKPMPANMSFAQQVVDFASQKKGRSGPAKALNVDAVHWQADREFLDREARPAPMAQTPQGQLVIKLGSGLDRAQGALSEMIAHGAKPPLFVDMMDARFLGTPKRRAAPQRTVVYNRRIGAKNLTLWPLPAYHTLAPRGAVGGFPIDDIPFEDKVDRCVWLGNMTGRMSPVLTPEGRELRGVYGIRKQALALSRAAPEWADVIADLSCVPRYNIVKTLRDNPDFAVGLVLRDVWKKLAKSPAFVGLSVAKRPREWFYQFRYILSLAGNDTGSNFLPAAASNALILKEEDGWELFYTDAFKPWEHYVPLEEGALDVEEKLAWARAHPQDCARMVAASTEVFDRLANPANRTAILRGIAERLNASV